ncbi:MAG: hypothetical protein ACK4L4_04365 [Gemmobacter sp.]
MHETAAIAEHERRLSAALDRIGKAIDALAAAPATSPRRGAPPPAADDALAAEVERLREALEVERAANAQLTERLRAVKDRDGQARAQAEMRIEVMTRQLDLQGLELTRMRKTTIQLRDSLRAMTEAAAAVSPEPHLINKAMLAELEALRAQRQTEVAEMDEILTALAPLLEEAPTDA